MLSTIRPSKVRHGNGIERENTLTINWDENIQDHFFSLCKTSPEKTDGVGGD